jgi:hypothetical protein
MKQIEDQNKKLPTIFSAARLSAKADPVALRPCLAEDRENPGLYREWLRSLHRFAFST